MMSRFAVIERASIDEAYMDLTSAIQQRLKDMTSKQIEPHLLKTTYVQGYPQDQADEEESAQASPSDKGMLVKDVRKLKPLGSYSLLILCPLLVSTETQRSRGLEQWLSSLPVPLSVEQCPADLQLTMGAVIVEEMRAAVEKDTGFSCSAGISHNKVSYHHSS